MVFISTAFFLAVCFGIPLGALAWSLRQGRRLAAAFGCGLASFAVSQVLLRLPLLNALGGTAWFVAFTMTSPFLYVIFLAVSAAAFEESARFLFLRPQRHREFDLRIPFAFGLGHGGLEALLMGGSVVASLLASPGQVGFLGGALFASGFERLAAMACHVAFSLLVYDAVMRRRPASFAAALALHFLVDAAAGLAGYAVIPLFLFEALLAVFAAIQLWLVFKFVSKRKEPSCPN